MSHGKTTNWTSTGYIELIDNYKNNQVKGYSNSYYPNGRVKAKLNYKPQPTLYKKSKDNSFLEGKNTTWYDNGAKQYEGIHRSINDTFGHSPPEKPWVNSNKIGIHQWWNKDGSIDKTENYKD